MKKILKYLIIFIICCYMINVIRNLIILNNIKEKINQLNNINEFSFIIKRNNNITNKIVEKDGIRKIEMYDKNEIRYFNTKTNEYIIIDSKTGEKKSYSNQDEYKVSIDLKKPELNNIFLLSLKSIMLPTKVNGEKCYKIKNDTWIYYISYKNGLTQKLNDGNSTYEYSDYNINNVDKSEIEY